MPNPILSPLRGKRVEVVLPAHLAATLPTHTMRVEPLFYSGSLLFAVDDPPAAEVVNDTGGLLGDFWRVIRDEEDFQRFVRLCQSTPFCERAFNEAKNMLAVPGLERDSVKRAWAFFVMNRQGTLKDPNKFGTFSKMRTRRHMTESASSFLATVDKLPEFHKRLRGVTVLTRDPLNILKEFDKHDVMIVITPRARDLPYRTLGEMFGSDDFDYDSEVRHVLSNLTAYVMIVLEPNQPVEQVFECWRFYSRDFEVRSCQSWSRRPPRPARIWTNFPLAVETECGHPARNAHFFL